MPKKERQAENDKAYGIDNKLFGQRGMCLDKESIQGCQSRHHVKQYEYDDGRMLEMLLREVLAETEQVVQKPVKDQPGRGGIEQNKENKRENVHLHFLAQGRLP